MEWTVTGDSEEFRRLARQASEMVRAEEPGTLRYLWYHDAECRTFLLTECYADSAAMLVHGRNIARLLPALTAVAHVTRFEILGDLSPEAEAAAREIGASRFQSFGGLKR